MRIIEPRIEILEPLYEDMVLKKIEVCGRTCYKSEDKIGDGSAARLVGNFIKSGHESVLEHYSFSVKFTVDRGVSHEIVRHRVASYSQESTRYCNYSKDKFGNEITVIRPCYLEEGTEAYSIWSTSCAESEKAYFDLLDYGLPPEEARAVLPTSLKTELVMTASLREWRHFLKLRCDSAAHPQIRQVSRTLLAALCEELPTFFKDIQDGLIGEE